MQKECRILSVEVKLEENVKEKSLSHIVAAHEGMKGVSLSMSDYRDQTWMENIPMFAVLYAP